MAKVTSAAYAAAGKALLGYVEAGNTIPYVPGGMGLGGMDCQGLAEYLLIQCGVPGAECNLAGSNAHWRGCVWRGTPEECKARFGAVPPGAWVFIVNEDDGGAPAKYRGDGLGDASHMGVYLGGESAVHASASRGRVAESRFAGKTIPNGGWNMIGLPPWVDYGGHVNAALGDGGDAEDGGEEGGTGADVSPEDTGGGPVDAAYWARVYAANGKPVKMRAEPSRECALYKNVPVGETLRVIGGVVKGGTAWLKVERNSRRWWMMAEYLQRAEG